MELTHRFSVPTTVEDTWARFQDVAALAECFPGATVASVEDDAFTGSAKVKLGPIALVYQGSGSFASVDAEAHRMVVEAKGKDKRGNGTAGATVTLSMAGSPERTDVEVITELSVTGKPAQFGRGMMQEVSDKLLRQFVECLEQRLVPAAGPEDAAPDPGDAPAAPAPGAAPAAAAPAGVASSGPASHGSDDALDLGATMLPVLVKSYWKQLLGIVVALLVLRRLLGR